MSKKGFFVADAKNFLQKEILKMVESKSEGDYIRVTLDNEDRDKFGKVTKILNKKKPKLLKNYL